MGVQTIMVANRSPHRARDLAQIFEDKTKTVAFALSEIKDHLSKADIVISATSSSLPLLSKPLILEALALRKRKPMVMLDLGLPRNIATDVLALEDVYLYCMDDLHPVLAKHRSLRQVAAKSAEAMIVQASGAFMHWLEAQDSFKIVSVFREKFESLRDELLADGLRRLERGQDPAQILQRLAHHLTNQFLHTPTHLIRVAGLRSDHELLTFMKRLFELDHEIIPTE